MTYQRVHDLLLANFLVNMGATAQVIPLVGYHHDPKVILLNDIPFAHHCIEIEDAWCHPKLCNRCLLLVADINRLSETFAEYPEPPDDRIK